MIKKKKKAKQNPDPFSLLTLPSPLKILRCYIYLKNCFANNGKCVCLAPLWGRVPAAVGSWHHDLITLGWTKYATGKGSTLQNIIFLILKHLTCSKFPCLFIVACLLEIGGENGHNIIYNFKVTILYQLACFILHTFARFLKSKLM